MLNYFPRFIFDVICRKSEMLRLVRTSAISAFTRPCSGFAANSVLQVTSIRVTSIR
jgi:hypothetical protein